MATSTSIRVCQFCEAADNIAPLVTVHMLHIFAVIASANETRKGLHMAELAKMLGMHSSTTSRNIQALGLRHGKELRPGLDLVVTEPDPTDKRAFLIFVTPKGRLLWDKLKSIMRKND